MIVDNGGEVHLPAIGETFYVVEMWQDMGLVLAGGMGATQLSSLEILAWSHCTLRTVTPWEFSTIKEMSMSYLAMLHEGEKPETGAPLAERVYDPVEFEKRLLASLDSMIAK